MKKLLAIVILILTFQAPSQADDIRDFQIEGMSIGDSLLDYFSEEEIKKDTQKVFPKSNKFLSITFRFLPKFEVYDGVQFFYKKNDKKYIVYQITGQIYYEDFKDCNKKYNKIVSEFSDLFPDATMRDEGHREHSKLKSSYYQRTWFKFDSGDNVYVVCYDWSEETNMRDGLGVAINQKEYYNFLQNDAY